MWNANHNQNTYRFRLEQVLVAQAHQYSPDLLQNLPHNQTRMVKLADGLSRRGVLVVLADVDQQDYRMALERWVALYSSFYFLFAAGLFPTHSRYRIGLADQQYPPVLILNGESAPVVRAMSLYVAPFATYVQQRGASVLELSSTIWMMLDWLEARTLPSQKLYDLYYRGVELLRQILYLPVQQYAQTFTAPNLLALLQQRQEGKQPPSTLPGLADKGDRVPSQEVFLNRTFDGRSDSTRIVLDREIPIFYERDERNHRRNVRDNSYED